MRLHPKPVTTTIAKVKDVFSRAKMRPHPKPVTNTIAKAKDANLLRGWDTPEYL